MEERISGGEALFRCLEAEGVTTVFGYPGGTIMPVYDNLYDHTNKITHILARHEQGAIHEAEGYARVSGKTGVVIATSGPGATNLVTGIADARIDSTPLVVITGQVGTNVLGNDAFQETDFIDVTNPISKWGILVRNVSELPDIIARAFYIANSGRPGPVVVDIPRNVQLDRLNWKGYKKCNFIRSYEPRPKINLEKIEKLAELINTSERPLILAGRGILTAEASAELQQFAEKADLPVATTMLGLSSLPKEHRLNKGMLGMHGNIAPNIATNKADLIIGVGLRFDDRVIGKVSEYAKEAKIVHIDIDPSEMGRTIKPYLKVHSDAKDAIKALIPLVKETKHDDWLSLFDKFKAREDESTGELYFNSKENSLMNMAEVVNIVSDNAPNDSILVTDVGQNQMTAVRYFKYSFPGSVVTSGGLGTMGYGLPAAIGAKIACPDKTVCLFCGDGGFQMTEQELGTIMEYNVGVKMIILNNNYLGNVRQWQKLFFRGRYSQTPLLNPDFIKLAEAYGIKGENVAERNQLQDAIRRLFYDDRPYLLNINIDPEDMVFPMISPGATLDDIMLNEIQKLEGYGKES